MGTLWGREPAMVVAFVGAVIALAVAFGLHLSDEQTGAILAVVTLLLGLVTRSQVSSPATVASIRAGVALAPSPTAPGRPL